jgi:cytosine/adenosine deaminase-related metal-dependent hydrolase
VVSAPWVLTGPLTPTLSPGPGPGERETIPRGGDAIRDGAAGFDGGAIRDGGAGFDGGAIRDGAVALDGDTILAVGPRAAVEARHGKAERLDAVILPALVNAHLHLELSHMAGMVPGGEGLPAWIELFVSARARTRQADALPAMTMAAEDLVRAGVAAVGDVSNSLDSLAPLAAAGLAGTIFHEVFGVTPHRMADALARASALRARAPAPPPGLRVVPSPHALYSTHHPSLVDLLRAGPGSIHLAEDPAERTFVATGKGGFGHLLARMGAAGVDLVPRARSAVALVAPHLAAHHLAVHCVDLDDEDVRLLAASGATVVLCPRSNEYIGGALPRLDALLAAGIPLAVGTDSLASAPSLAPLADVARLRRAFPAIPAARVVALAWNGAAVGAPHVGALRPGSAPGILAAPTGGAPVEDPFELLVALGAEERPFEWIARQRPPAPASPRRHDA